MPKQAVDTSSACKNCGKLPLPRDEAFRETGGKLCGACSFRCGKCGQWSALYANGPTMVYLRASSETTVPFCKLCWQKYGARCSMCGRLTLRESFQHISRGWTSPTNKGSISVCDKCSGQVIGACAICRADLLKNNAMTFITHDGHKVLACNEHHAPDAKAAYNQRMGPFDYIPDHLEFYQWKGGPVRTGGPVSGVMYLGAELEMECGKDPCHMVTKIADMFDNVYLTFDGSLHRGSGIEVDAFPATLEWHQNTRFWRDLTALMAEHSYLSSSKPPPDIESFGCGFHVHVSKDALKPGGITLLKLAAFVHMHKQELTVMADRESNKYAKFKPAGRSDSIKRLLVNLEKYEAVNFTNAQTVEFRIFSGTTRWPRILSYLEAADGITRFVNAASIEEITNRKASWSSFCKYLLDNAARYSHILRKMRNDKLLMTGEKPLKMWR